jgi:hypothetical protein
MQDQPELIIVPIQRVTDAAIRADNSRVITSANSISEQLAQLQ